MRAAVFMLLMTGMSFIVRSADAGSLRLNEIFFQSALPDRPVMIELQNAGGEALDISGYTLVDCENHTYSFPAGATVAPHGIAVAVFGRAEQVADLLNEEAAWFFCDDEALNQKIFRNKLAQSCSVYPSAEQLPEQRIDYLTWGHETFSLKFLGKYGNVMVRTIPLATGDWALPLDGSLARFATLPQEVEWMLLYPDDVSIGRPNPWPTPRILYFADGGDFELDPGEAVAIPYDFTWVGARAPDGYFRFQAAEDPRFRKIFADETVPGFRGELVAPVASFFLRLRWEGAGSAGRWSQVYNVNFRLKAPGSLW